MQVDLYNGRKMVVVVVVDDTCLLFIIYFGLFMFLLDVEDVNRLLYLGDTHICVFNGPLSGTTWVSLYQKGKTSLDFTEARDSEW